MPGPYSPNPIDYTEPLDSYPVGVGAAEFRALKAYIQANLVGVPLLISGASTLVNGQLGNNVILGGTGAPYTVDLPVVNTCQNGLGYIFQNQSATPTAVTISIGASDRIVNAGALVTTIVLQQGDFAILIGDNVSKWYMGINSLNLNAAILAARLPVGAVVLSANNVNPGTSVGGGGYGYGTWMQIAEGRVLIGVGTGTDINAVSKTYAAGNDTVGEYAHSQTAGEVGAHHHQAESRSGGGITPSFATSNGGVSTPLQTDDAGSGTPMNVTQPSFGVYIWQRTA